MTLILEVKKFERYRMGVISIRLTPCPKPGTVLVSVPQDLVLAMGLSLTTLVTGDYVT